MGASFDNYVSERYDDWVAYAELQFTLLKVSKMLCLIYDGIKNFLFINWFKAVIWMAFG